MKNRRIPVIILIGLLASLFTLPVQAATLKDVTFPAEDGSFVAELTPEDATDTIILKATGVFSTGGMIAQTQSLNNMFFPQYFEPDFTQTSTFVITNNTGFAYAITDYHVTVEDNATLLEVISFSFDEDAPEAQARDNLLRFNEYLSKTPENEELVSRITYGDIGSQKIFNTWAYMDAAAGNQHQGIMSTVTFEFTLERETSAEPSVPPAPSPTVTPPVVETPGVSPPPTAEIPEVTPPMTEIPEATPPLAGPEAPEFTSPKTGDLQDNKLLFFLVIATILCLILSGVLHNDLQSRQRRS